MWSHTTLGAPGRRGAAGRLASRPYRVLAGAGLLLLTGCEMPLALEPRGPAAAHIADLWWLLLGTATAVCIVVFALLGFALAGRRGGGEPHWFAAVGTRFVYIGGGLIPAVILTGFTYVTLAGLAPFDERPESTRTVTVRGYQFWWEIDYQGEAVRTANELHIPVGEPVRIELESADVIHSFWVPQLHGKLEMIPGHVNSLYLEADEPGEYLGKCAEFCGSQHARMELLVIAQEPHEFEAWLDRQKQEAAEPASDLARRGRDVFANSQCSLCHRIRGVPGRSAQAGPDLTHLASRRTLAARTLPNTRGNLGGWIADPQGVKPGAQMPAVNLPSDDFLALLEYLDGLE